MTVNVAISAIIIIYNYSDIYQYSRSHLLSYLFIISIISNWDLKTDVLLLVSLPYSSSEIYFTTKTLHFRFFLFSAITVVCMTLLEFIVERCVFVFHQFLVFVCERETVCVCVCVCVCVESSQVIFNYIALLTI